MDGTLVPTLLRAFELQVAGAAVVARWSVSAPAEVTDFRLDARSGSLAWTVPCAADGADFSARDASPQLAACAGREIVYTLQRREGPDRWAMLAERAFLPPPPAAGLQLVARPNPFNPRVEVAFTLGRPAAARLSVFALDGRRVAIVFTGDLPAGRQTLAWDGRDSHGAPAASGTYVLRLEADDLIASREVMLVR